MKIFLFILFLFIPSTIVAQCSSGDLLKLNIANKTYECVAPSALPISSITQSTMDLKAPLASPTFTGTVSGVTKSMVGLSNVDNTSDSSKVLTESQVTNLVSDLSTKAPTASPTFSGTVTISTTLKLSPLTVSTLPTCNAGAIYTIAIVSDGLLPTFLASVTGGGAVKVPVMCNGSNWIVF